MKLKDIIKDLEIIETACDTDMEITSICFDSRKAEKGSLFVAVSGFATDGHKYISSAREKGASAVICEKAPDCDVPYIIVPNSRKALALAACSFYDHPSSRMKMIGLTGTNGKTTTTHLIKHILETTQDIKTGLIGTNGVMFGSEFIPSDRTTPESLELQEMFAEMAASGCKCCTMEVSSHSLELDRVAGMFYDVAAFTNLTQDHLDFHVTMDNYAKAKAKLFAVCGCAVINRDDPYSDVMIAVAKKDVITFGIDSDCDLKAQNVVLHPTSTEFSVSYKGDTIKTVIHIPGRFSVYNALCAIGCCLGAGASLEECCSAIETAHGVKGRMEPVPGTTDFTVLIDYSHTPDALENAIKTVKETSLGRTVALFGCGGDRDRTKRPIMGNIGTTLADYSYITSDNPRTEDPEEIIKDILAGVNAPEEKYCVITDRSKAIERAILDHKPGDTIILAGKGHETYQEINHVKHHMDEREIAAAAIEKLKQGV